MNGVSFTKAQAQLPSYCFSLLQAASPADQDAVANQMKKLDQFQMNDRVKGLLLGAVLVKVVGTGVLDQAVSSLGSDIRDERRNPDPTGTPPATGIPPATATLPPPTTPPGTAAPSLAATPPPTPTPPSSPS
jgi:hypothetical protein